MMESFCIIIDMILEIFVIWFLIMIAALVLYLIGYGINCIIIAAKELFKK